jgi:formylglycine-generating enzyme required for sulfatase activity/serine/threonine protein kinase
MSQHPTKEELSGFLLGKLAAPASDVVAEHIDECPPCQNTLSELSSQFDTLVKGLQKPAPSEVDSVGRDAVKEVAAKAPQATPAATPPAPKPQSPLKQAEQSQPSQMGTSGGTIISRAAFRTSLISSGIYDADDLSELERKHPPVAQAADGRELARALVQCGALSKYQATAVYQGKLKGLVYGEYAVVDLLGEGGMGQVFKARHRSMDRIVALKVLAKAAVGSPDAVKRFQREVKAAAKLIHPNIVTAFDASRHDGTHYLVMEFVPGSDLSAVVKKQGPLPIAQAVNYTIQAARGLAFAHSKGVVHRDIKPANLLVDGEGVVKILDMGLARLELEGADAGAGHGLTQTGQIMGTVDYMAPEQAFDTSKADAKADVYSLGCTLYRLLTGGNVFGGDTLMQKLLAHRELPTPSLRAVRPEVSAELDVIFLRMMAKQPQDRPTMTELIAELEVLDRGEATAAFVPTSIAKDSQSGSLFAVKPITTVGRQEPQNTISLVTPAVKPAGRGKKPPINRLVLGAAAAGAAALCLWAIIVQFKDKDGNVIAEASVPNAASASIVVTPNAAATSVPPARLGLPPIDHALERKVAQWLLDHGLVTILNVAGKRVTLTPGTPLPTEPFYVDQLHKSLRGSIPRQELLAGLADFRRLSRFSGNHLPSRDGDLWAEVYGTLPTVTSVNAAYSDWTDAGAAHLARLPNLHYVNFGNCPNITARGLFALRASTQLETLEVDEKQLAAGKYTLADIQQLQDALPTTRFYLAGFRPIPGLKPAASRTDSGGSLSAASTAAVRWPYDPADGREYVWSTPENLGSGVNYGRRDLHPRLTDDELTLIFYRDTQLMTARRKHRDEPFGPCEPLVGKVQDLKSEGMSITGDGLELFLYNTVGSRDVWSAKRSSPDQPFGDPVRLEPPVNSAQDDQYPTISADGLSLFVTSGRSDMRRTAVKDVFLFQRKSRSEPFGPPILLGRDVNAHDMTVSSWVSSDLRVLLTTVIKPLPWLFHWHARPAIDEPFSAGTPNNMSLTGPIETGSPWVSPDGKRMYFHSRDIPGGHGELDLWMVRRVAKGGVALVAPFDAAQDRARQEDWAKRLGMQVETVNGVGQTMILIPPGEFSMGSTKEQVQAALKSAEGGNVPVGEVSRGLRGETPQHKVAIVNPILMSATEVTNRQFQRFVEESKYVTDAEKYGFGSGSGDVPIADLADWQKQHQWRTPGYQAQDDAAVTQVSWNDAAAYCRWLSAQEGATYRLPTEAEWEYACRAGTTTEFGFGDMPEDLPKYGWHFRKGGPNVRGAQPVGMLLPNRFGLFDMHGNVFEWCRDFYADDWYASTPETDPTGPADGSRLVCRGGSWYSPDRAARSAARNGYPSTHRCGFLGFRVVREVAAPAVPGKLFMHDPGFPQWVRDVQAMPAERQVEAVRQKLMQLNPGFDGKLWGYHSGKPIGINRGVVTELGMSAEFIADISPVQALSGLKVLTCVSPRVRSERFSDLSPLAGMQLGLLFVGRTAVRDLTPLKGMRISELFIDETQVSDLSPLVGMPLLKVTLNDTPVSDLTPLEGCRGLKDLHVKRTKATPTAIAALRQALPNCKIDADAQAAPVSQPTPTGTK